MARKNQADRPEPDQMTFEQALEELETIVGSMEQGQVPLAQALDQYERGVKLIKRCRGLLAQAEKKIELLSEDDKGKPVTEPLDIAEDQSP